MKYADFVRLVLETLVNTGTVVVVEKLLNIRELSEVHGTCMELVVTHDVII